MRHIYLLSTLGAALFACGGSGDTTGAGGATASDASTGATSTSTSTASGSMSASATSSSSTGAGGGMAGGPYVFLILMENHNWSAFKGSASAPYVNGTLLTQGAHAEQYYNPKNIHPSEPNYLWLEAGDNFGIFDDSAPSQNSQSTTAHLVTQMEAAGVSWKSYQEDIDGVTCPLNGVKKYAPKHNPMIFFEDVTNKNDPMAPRCIAHVRPYTELATDLSAGTVANYNFLTPNLCNDGHDSCAPQNDEVKQSDDWLAAEVPKILASDAYKTNGVIMITWDEGEGSDGPIGFIVMSKYAKTGYTGSMMYTHSSTLKTVQGMFNLMPLLGDAATQGVNDLSDLFTTLPGK